MSTHHTTRPTALITGGSAGLGYALATALAKRGWHLILDARGAERLSDAAQSLGRHTTVEARVGSVADAAHRSELVDAAYRAGRLDLLVNNASELGASPQPVIADLTEAMFSAVIATNATAPLQLMRNLGDVLSTTEGAVINLSSDAAVEHYPGWGAYGASKAALDHLTGTLSAEHPDIDCYAFDPGDMRTALHQAAFPDEDISDRPAPEAVIPALLSLLDTRPPSGRYRAEDLGPHSGESTAAQEHVEVVS
ncbi:MAG: SDR family oxidoreductase [Ornithinimicrobium sp.]